MNDSDREANRFSARAARYARVGANVGGVAARMAGTRLFGCEGQRASNAAALAQALGGLKGPIMKVAQLLATIPDVVPPEYAAELQKLQSEAPPMGGAFVKRRMQAELGPDWQARFGSLRPQAGGGRFARPGAPRHLEGRRAARLQAAISRHAVRRRGGPAAARSRLRPPSPHGSGDRHPRDRQGDRRAGARGARLPPRGQACRALPRGARGVPEVRVPTVVPDLSTAAAPDARLARGREDPRLHKSADREIRNRLAVAMFKAWWHPFSHAAVIHGDPHLGNYTVFSEDGEARGHQPARLRLHPHLPSALRRRRRRSLPRAPARRPRPDRPRLRDLGLQAALERS